MTKPRHSWDHDNVKRIIADDTESGCEETIRTCLICGLIKITVHGRDGRPWPEFMMLGSGARIPLSTTPPCRRVRSVEAMESDDA